MKIVWPDQHSGPRYRYERMNNRPDFPSEAVLILDTVPMPTPDVRRHVWLAEPLPASVADHWDFVLVTEEGA